MLYYKTNIQFSLLAAFLILATLSHAQEVPDTFYIEEVEFYEEDTTYYIDQYPDEIYTDRWPRIQFLDLGFTMGSPQAAFRRNLDRLIWGGYINYSIQLEEESPIFVGAMFDMYVLNRAGGKVERVFDGFVEEWNASTTSSMLSLSFTGKYFLNRTFLNMEPYVEMRLGGRLMNTVTSFTFEDSEESDSDFETPYTTFFFGAKFGLMAPISDNVYIHTSVGYSQGLSTRYYVKKQGPLPSPVNSSLEYFDLKKSATDLLYINLGVNIVL